MLNKFGGAGGVQQRIGKLGGELGGAFGGVAKNIGFSMPGQLGSLMSGIANPGVMGLGLAAGAYATVQQYAAHAKELKHNSAKMGLGAEQYQELELGANKSGYTIEEMAISINHMRRVIAEAEAGNKTYSASILKLGISVEEISKMNAGQQLEAVSKGVKSLDEAAQFFGRNAVPLMPMLQKLGKNGLNQFKDDLIMTQREVDALARLKTTLFRDVPRRIEKQIAGAAAPAEEISGDVKKGNYWTAFKRFVHTNFDVREGSIADWIVGRKNELSNPTLPEKEDEEGYKSPVLDTTLHGLAGLAMKGTQEAYQIQTAHEFDVDPVVEKLDAIAENTGRIPLPDDIGSY